MGFWGSEILDRVILRFSFNIFGGGGEAIYSAIDI